MPGVYYVLVSLLLVLQSINTKSDMDAKAFSSSVARFSAKFVNELNKSKSSVSSPLSAEFVLALLALGTTGDSHEELLTSLGIADDDSIRSSFTAVSSKLKSIKGVTLNIANKVYVMEGGYDLQAQVKDDAIKVFDADIEKLNFGDAQGSADNINKWVEAKTNQRIKDLISADDLDSLTRLVLVNAIYFKGTWQKQFDPHNTIEQPFFLTASDTVNVPMMYREDNYRYGISKELNSQLLEMPYVGGEASMLIILPNEIEGLGEVLQKLAAGHDLLADVDNMHNNKVQVTIPKFKIETQIDLGVLLPKIGISKIFDKANSGLTRLLNADEILYVSKGIQKAFIEVNEEGAEAAAATALGIMLCSAMIDEPPVPEFRADHPFLAVVVVDGAMTFFADVRSFEN